MSKTQKPRKNFKSNLSLICSKDPLKPGMNIIQFINGKAVATDGHLLIESNLRIHGFDENEIKLMEGKQIDRTKFNMMVKHRDIEVQKNGFYCKDADILYEFCKVLVTFPDYERAIPPKPTNEIESNFINCIGLNYKYICRLCDAMVQNHQEVPEEFIIDKTHSVEEGFVFTFFAKDTAVIVNHWQIRGQRGIIMPVLLYPEHDAASRLQFIKAPIPNEQIL